MAKEQKTGYGSFKLESDHSTPFRAKNMSPPELNINGDSKETASGRQDGDDASMTERPVARAAIEEDSNDDDGY